MLWIWTLSTPLCLACIIGNSNRLHLKRPHWRWSMVPASLTFHPLLWIPSSSCSSEVWQLILTTHLITQATHVLDSVENCNRWYGTVRAPKVMQEARKRKKTKAAVSGQDEFQHRLDNKHYHTVSVLKWHTHSTDTYGDNLLPVSFNSVADSVDATRQVSW